MAIFGSRVPSLITRNKPRVVLNNKQFLFVNTLDLDEKGQLDAVVTVDSLRMRMDEDDVERRMITLEVNKAEMIINRATRLE